jgi:hypothetical protein
MIFYSIRKENDVQYKTEEEILQAHRGVKYNNDHQALVIWSIDKRDKIRIQEISNVEHIGTLTVYRADEVDSEEINKMTREMVDFRTMVSGKEKHRFLELNAKFEEILKAYEERGNKIQLLENQVSQMDKQLGKRKVGESSRPRIVYP